MNAKYISFCLILLSSVVMTACDMETKVFDELTTDKFPQNEAQLLRTIAPAYTAMKGYADAVWQSQTVTTDEGIVVTRGSDWNNGGYFRRLSTHTYTPAPSGNPDGVWNFCVNGIAQVNQILYQLSNVTVDFSGKSKKEAELKVIRAFFYLVMLDNYRNIYIKTDFADASAPVQVSPQAAFDFIASEIRANLDLLEATPSASNYGLITQSAAHAMLAKLYLNAEVYTGTPHWQECIDECNAIIDKGYYSLSEKFMDNFKEDNTGSKENIFSIPFDRVRSTGFSHHVYALHYNSGQTYGLSYAPWNGYSTLADHYNLFEDADQRKQIFLEGQQYAASGAALTTRDNKPLIFTRDFTSTDPWNENGTGGVAENQGIRVLKYVPGIGTGRHMSNDFAVFRYADVLLMKAECLVRLQRNGEALPYINTVRERSLPGKPYTAISLEELYKERRREFTWEGMAKQDMIRFGKYEGTWTYHPTGSAISRRIFPIPEAVRSLNPSLKQNPEY